MRYALLLCCIGLLPLLGCSPETAPVEETPDTGFDWLSSDGQLHYTTPEGKIVRGHATSEGGVVFSIQNGKDSFGFELAETHLYEWAIENDERHDLRIEYNPGLDRVDYFANGRHVSKRKSEMPEFTAAKAGPRGEPFYLAAVDLKLEDVRVFDNPLGDELVNTLAGLDEEIRIANRWVEEDGQCSGALRNALAACITLKCGWGGGVANPVCHACVGTQLACLVMSIAYLFGGGGG